MKKIQNSTASALGRSTGHGPPEEGADFRTRAASHGATEKPWIAETSYYANASSIRSLYSAGYDRCSVLICCERKILLMFDLM